MADKKGSIFYIDLLRFLGASAVVLIHVLGPFRKLYGEIPDFEWCAALTINALSRWAVPVFMMISGALLLSSKKSFHLKEYFIKRISKVFVPFILWTVIYSFINTKMGAEGHGVGYYLKDSISTPAWYHLWFFYDFIPLYFVVPFLIKFLKRLSEGYIKVLLSVFAFLFLLKWFEVDTFLCKNIILYTGYFVWGWYLFNRDNSKEIKYWCVGGIGMLLLNVFGSWWISVSEGAYSSFFMGYKTLNTLVIAVMIFVLAQKYGDQIKGRFRTFVSMVAKYSLGIYLLHPILLIPVRNIDNGYYDFFGTNWVAIPAISFCVMLISLFITMVFAHIPILKRLVP